MNRKTISYLAVWEVGEIWTKSNLIIEVFLNYTYFIHKSFEYFKLVFLY